MPTIDQGGNAFSTAMLIGTTDVQVVEIMVNNGIKVVHRSGNIGLAVPLVNNSIFSSAQLDLNVSGAIISRNIADANPALKINQAHAGSTGNLLTLQKNSSTVAQINTDGSTTGLSIKAQGSNTYTNAAILLTAADAAGTGPVTGGNTFQLENNGTSQLTVNHAGDVNIKSLAGTGTRMVTADSSGTLGSSTFTNGTVTLVSGTTDRITVATGSTTPSIDIASTYVGQTSINTLGTIGTGTWNGDTIDAGNGGTGLTSAGASGNVLTSNGSAWISATPAIFDQWTDTSGYAYIGANSPNLGAGKGLDSQGGYASNCQELVTQFGGVDENVEFVYRVDPTNSDWTLYLPDPSLFRKRVLNITNFSTDTNAGIILEDFLPVNTENGITVDYLSSVKGDPTLPQWIQIMSIYTTVNGIANYYWMIIKAGRKQNF